MVKAKPKAARTAEARARSGDVTARVELFIGWLGAVASGKESLTFMQLLGLLSSSVAVAAIGFSVYLLTRSGVLPLEASDTATLRRVFFSGEPWLVECTPRGRASPMVYEMEGSMRGVAMGTLACDATLPSGQTTFERFKLKPPSYGPVVLAAANMERPQIAPKNALASAATLAAWAKGATKPKLYNPASGAQFESQCARKPWCLVVLTAGSRLADSERKALQSLAERERRLRITKVRARGEPRACAWRAACRAALLAHTTAVVRGPAPDRATIARPCSARRRSVRACARAHAPSRRRAAAVRRTHAAPQPLRT